MRDNGTVWIYFYLASHTTHPRFKGFETAEPFNRNQDPIFIIPSAHVPSESTLISPPFIVFPIFERLVSNLQEMGRLAPFEVQGYYTRAPGCRTQRMITWTKAIGHKIMRTHENCTDTKVSFRGEVQKTDKSGKLKRESRKRTS